MTKNLYIFENCLFTVIPDSSRQTKGKGVKLPVISLHTHFKYIRISSDNLWIDS